MPPLPGPIVAALLNSSQRPYTQGNPFKGIFRHNTQFFCGFISWILFYILWTTGSLGANVVYSSPFGILDQTIVPGLDQTEVLKKTTKPHVRLLQALLIWLKQSKDLLVYKIHYSQEIKIIYHSFLHEPPAMQSKAMQLGSFLLSWRNSSLKHYFNAITCIGLKL